MSPGGSSPASALTAAAHPRAGLTPAGPRHVSRVPRPCPSGPAARSSGATRARTPASTVASKEVERESPMCTSSSHGNVCCRNARLAADPHVVNTCARPPRLGLRWPERCHLPTAARATMRGQPPPHQRVDRRPARALGKRRARHAALGLQVLAAALDCRVRTGRRTSQPRKRAMRMAARPTAPVPECTSTRWPDRMPPRMSSA